MRRIDLLSALETFVCAVDEGSLSQAARRLAKTPSAVTKAIAGLEETLGVQLLERTTRKLVLTEGGRLYLATATDVLRRLADGARQLSEHDDEPRGLLRVTAAHSFGHAILAPLCLPFTRAFPRVRIELSLSDHYVDIVGEGYDLALRMGNYDLPSQIVKPIGSNRSLLCASPGYLAQRGRPVAPADLARHDCVIYRHPTLANTWAFDRDGTRERIEPKGPLATDNYGLALAATLDGAGILPCPQWSVVDALEAGRLVPLLVEWRFESASFGEERICAAYPSSRRGSTKIRRLVERVEAKLADSEARIARALGEAIGSDLVLR
ncbi:MULTISPECIES: LysR family transcriptional regulator [unclassified Burkholderia]|uniref:LysR family transcriptional regulator n=1 Tax=unclassified Burkholderia TaxID=2613784 RepID=UPI000754E5BC|nr:MULTISPECIES: LysR family transcriptional regulator [unclassified Burkholderia]AOK48549.1 LysR family transcriptional regulator [Burkholderia sp. MSMB617WGS]KVK90491.1 LysR family transcriptional regulator [Burkholderia sp. MSMB1498]